MMVEMNSFLVCILCLPVFLAAIPMKDCGSKKAKINFVTLNNCQTSPCNIKKGTFANFTVNFTPNEKVTSGKVKVWGILEPLPPIPFALDNNKLCNGTGLTCPLQAGKAVSFGNHLEVKTIYPSDTDKLCNGTGLPCALQVGKSVTFGKHLEVKPIYPSEEGKYCCDQQMAS